MPNAMNGFGLFILDGPDAIVNFLERIGEKGCTTKSTVDKITVILEMIQYPVTIVCESEYVDRIYRDTYYTYFAGKHTKLERNCKRLAFFQGSVELELLYRYDEEAEQALQNNFVGICVLRPIKNGKIGRTVLNPAKHKFKGGYLKTTEFDFIVLGHALTVDGFVYSSQDSETMTCAEITVWSILEYFGTRYSEYRTVLPSQIIGELGKISTERVLPSRGLSYFQVSELLKVFGFFPRLYARSAFNKSPESLNTFKNIFHYYIESGIPLAVGVSEKSGGAKIGHSVVCIGHGYKRRDIKDVVVHNLDGSGAYQYIDSADLYNDYVIMDDNRAPYRVEPFDQLTKYEESEVSFFVAPLYRRVFLEASDISAIVTMVLRHRDIGFLNMIPNLGEALNLDNPLVLRVFLTSSRKYRGFRARHTDQHDVTAFYGTLQLSKFVWVAEISTYSSYQQKKVYGEIVIDATSSRTSHIDSLIMVRYLDYVGYRMSDEGMRSLTNRLKHRTKSFTYPYDMYESNLKKCGGCDE